MPYPVLMYHDLAEAETSGPAGHRPYVLRTADFREQLGALARLGLTGERLDACLPSGTAKTPARACILTFDDGHESNLSTAVPLLVEAGFRATFFVTAGWMGRKPYMDWSQVRRLAETGMEIGSHSMTHRPPASLGVRELRQEMEDSRRLIEDRAGCRVTTASSPTGFFHSALPNVARDAGYRALCYGRIGLYTPGHDPFRIPRLAVKSGLDLPTFERMAGGDVALIGGMRRRQAVRDALKRGLGVRGYLAMRRWFMTRLGESS
jgi:peptidoglycan/xylan/chitin deacetylase (PgdA/CDA1 family)